MKIKNVYSKMEDTKQAVKEIHKQLIGFDAKLIVFFTTIRHDPAVLSEEMKVHFEGVELVGSSSLGTMISGEMFEKGLVAMAFHQDALEGVKVEVVHDIENYQEEDIKHAFTSFENYFGSLANQWSHKEYVGLILTNSMLNAEEKIMESISSMTNAFFVGGTAADDLEFLKSYTYAKGQFYTKSCVLVLMKPTMEFEVVKNQSFNPTKKVVNVTKANSEIREVIELDGKPVLDVYAELLNVPKEELSQHFFMNPLGIVTDDDVYIRSPYMISENDTLLFACSLLEGMEVHLLENGDIIDNMKTTLDEYKEKIGKITSILSFNCAYRLLELNAKKISDEYAKLFTDIPTVGMIGYGEAFLGHINQTSTMIIFK